MNSTPETTEHIQDFYDEFWNKESEAREFEEILTEARRDCLAYAQELLATGSKKRLLVIGPGSGKELSYFAKHQIIAIDLSFKALTETRKQCSQNRSGSKHIMINANAHQLPFARNTIEHAYMSLVLMHVQADKVIAEIITSLKPDGTLVIVEPLRHHPIAMLYRLLFSAFRDTQPKFLSLKELLAFGEKTTQTEHREFFILVPFILPLAKIKSALPMYRRLLPAVEKIDRILIKLFPWLGVFCWMSVVKYTKNKA